MVRIYGSGVPGGDVANDDFGTSMSKARDAAVEAAEAAAAEAGADGVAAPAAASAAGEGAGAAGSQGAARNVGAAGLQIPGATNDPADVAAQVEEFRAKALARFGDCVFGDEFALVVAVKTAAADSEAAADAAGGDNGFLVEPAGEALRKSLESLGYDPEALLGVVVPAAGTAAPAGAAPAIDARALRQIVELVDPAAVVAMDANASAMLEAAFADARLRHDLLQGSADTAAAVNGRTHVLLHDFEGSLDSIDAKRRAWAALRTLKRS